MGVGGGEWMYVGGVSGWMGVGGGEWVGGGGGEWMGEWMGVGGGGRGSRAHHWNCCTDFDKLPQLHGPVGMSSSHV